MLRTLSIAAAGVVAAGLAAEIILRVLPVSTATMTGYYVDPDVMTYPPGHSWTVATGWDLRNPQHLRANNWGFASPIDFRRDPDAAALIGDSFVEASMLDAADRPAAQLQRRLGGRPVYGLGSPGTALLDYAQRVRLAREHFGIVDQVLLLESGDARQALCGSGNVHSRCLDPGTLAPRIERLPEAGLLKRLARHSALAQYVFGQLKVDGRRLLATTLRRTQAQETPNAEQPREAVDGMSKPALTEQSRRTVDAVLDTFFAQVQPLGLRRLVFAVSGRRTLAAAPGSDLDAERHYLIERLRARGAEVIDLRPAFARHVAESPLSLNVGPYDPHLNRLGVGIVADEIAATLTEPRWPSGN